MHGGVADASAADQIKKAVEELISDAIVPLGEQDGNLCFHSEKLNDIEQERGTIPLRAVELRRIQNETLREAYSPLPSTHLNGTLSVQTALGPNGGYAPSHYPVNVISANRGRAG